jgi:hypothetical protein
LLAKLMGLDDRMPWPENIPTDPTKRYITLQADAEPLARCHRFRQNSPLKFDHATNLP